MRSGYFSYLSEEQLTELVSTKNYDAMKKAASHELIRIHEFSAVLRKKYRNDLTNPELSELITGLWNDNDNLESLNFITQRLRHLLLLQCPNETIANLITALIRSADDLGKSHCLYGMLASYNINKFSLAALEKLSDEERMTALNQLIEHSIYKSNISLLQSIQSTYPQAVRDFLCNVKKTHQDKIIARAKLMLEIDDPKDTICIAMSEFTEEPGKITYEGGLLTCARISSEAPYTFNPTIINGFGTGIDKPLEDYFDALSEMPLPIRERFITCDYHWTCGDIKIDENGNIEVLLIDSLGSCIDAAQICHKELKSRYPDSNITIYMTHEKRQYSDSGCSVFALNDVKQLYTIDKYLEPRYKRSGLFGYLVDHFSKYSANHYAHIKKCDLPIKFLRLAQTRNLFSKMFPERSSSEQALIINRKGETSLESSKKTFFNDKNERMNLKLLVSMAGKNADYLLKTDPDTIKRAKHAFTIEGFRERVQKMKSMKKTI